MRRFAVVHPLAQSREPVPTWRPWIGSVAFSFPSVRFWPFLLRWPWSLRAGRITLAKVPSRFLWRNFRTGTAISAARLGTRRVRRRTVQYVSWSLPWSCLNRQMAFCQASCALWPTQSCRKPSAQLIRPWIPHMGCAHLPWSEATPDAFRAAIAAPLASDQEYPHENPSLSGGRCRNSGVLPTSASKSLLSRRSPVNPSPAMPAIRASAPPSRPFKWLTSASMSRISG